MAYVWPDQENRLYRLRGAFELVDAVPVQLRRIGAADFLSEVELRDGHCTVLWHSTMWQYLERAEQSAVAREIERLGAAATADAPFARISMEPRRIGDGHHRFMVALQLWPDSRGELVLGRVAPHGVPVTWFPAPA